MINLPDFLYTEKGRVRTVLAALLAMDVILASCALLEPQLWFSIFHGTPYVDPQGFLPRTGASWAAFAILQALALALWERQPGWLLVVAGVRLGDCFTDWTYLSVAQDLTWFAYPALALASPANLLAGLFLARAYGKRTAAVPPDPTP
ncbi:MAG: hypothetical protein KKA60_12920 [Proteobacteria bacterium]|nr:hypothetical protein [Pseudomonadota bacterium]